MRLKPITVDDEQLLKFYKENSSEGLLNPLESIKIRGRSSYCVVDEDGEILAATSLSYPTKYLVKMHSTLVHPNHRGKGIGRFLNEEIEKKVKNYGYGKISSNIYINNLPSIFLKMKLGYVIEGTLYDHDCKGRHEYVLGKVI